MGGGASLRQSQKDVFHQHRTDHHFLTVDRQLCGGPVLFLHHGHQHQAAARHRLAGEPVDRRTGRKRRRNGRTEFQRAEVKASKRLEVKKMKFKSIEDTKKKVR